MQYSHTIAYIRMPLSHMNDQSYTHDRDCNPVSTHYADEFILNNTSKTGQCYSVKERKY